jgi:hypothetical protein
VRIFQFVGVLKDFCATFCATLGVRKPPVLGVRGNQDKIHNSLVNKGGNTCEKKSREAVRKCDFENFKSCASAISPHRQLLGNSFLVTVSVLTKVQGFKLPNLGRCQW